ncbi:MAG: DUF4476 domain-containing protein [Flavobacteriaceae bacterium]|nr:DUF4476 domain-containing protein [Flavobacteriaceae bacterium]
MKKLFLFVFGVFIASTLLSQATNNLVIFSEDGEKFTLFLNSVQQHETPESNVWVGALNAPAYKAKVVFENASIPTLEKTIYFQEPNTEVTLVIKNKKGEYKLRFLSSTPIPLEYVERPNQKAIMVVTEPIYTETVTTKTIIKDNGGDNVNVGVNIGGVGVNVNVNVNENISNEVIYEETTTVVTSTGGDHYIMQGYGGPIGCPWPMDPHDFQEAKTTIASKTFDDTRLKLAKQIVASNCLFADQVRDITKLMEFEETKLEFAKFAFAYTYDTGNYFKVSQVFDFESTVEELDEYISGY